jgi:hypothetical protein
MANIDIHNASKITKQVKTYFRKDGSVDFSAIALYVYDAEGNKVDEVTVFYGVNSPVIEELPMLQFGKDNELA